jgi:hypothetical protein
LPEISSKPTRRSFDDRVETPKKGLKVIKVFCEFENLFGMLSTGDQVILAADKVVMFMRAMVF